MGVGMAFKPFALICKPLVLCVGFIYPSYASYKALESKAPAAAAQWLTYWVVFSLFTVFEYFADWLISWVPFYYLAKLAFVLWLQMPQTQGATQVVYLSEQFSNDNPMHAIHIMILWAVRHLNGV